MVTLVGNEGDLTDLLQNLARLDYDAIEAYDAAIERLEDTKAQATLREFRKDHERHISDLTPHISGLGAEVPSGSGPKRLLTEGKVKIAALFGDSAILTAMATNEVETESAYRSASERDDVDTQLAEKLRAAMEDEARHKAWMKERA
jgi:hypothetical protein